MEGGTVIADEKSVQGKKTPYSDKTPTNAIGFAISQALSKISTAVPVTVQAVYKGETTGYVDALPLVGSVSGKGEYISPVTLYHLPYCRIQGGKAALIIDPVPGDKGLAVFTDSDASNVTAQTSEPQQPASYRKFSQSDGFYIGGFLNQKPITYIELRQDNTTVINSTGGVQINGTVTVKGDVIADGISLKNHVHTGDSGGTTSPPK